MHVRHVEVELFPVVLRQSAVHGPHVVVLEDPNLGGVVLQHFQTLRYPFLDFDHAVGDKGVVRSRL